MPIYVYQAKDPEKGCEKCKEPFEVFQQISSQPLEKCPKCGIEVKKIIQAVGFKMGKKHLLSEKNLKRHGFHKLVNEGDGKFRKIV